MNNKQADLLRYAEERRQLENKPLTAKEYQAAVKALADKYRI